jgi:uncharacterized phage protein gp47/JayE
MVTIPTLKQLYDAYVAAMEAEMQVTLPVFGKSYIRALAAVEAARDKLLYLALGSVQKNVFVDTADPASMGGTLERFGFVKLGRYPNPAQAGQYELTVTGSIGATIQASSTFKSNDDSLSPSKLFVLDNAFVLTAITDTITVRALEAGTGSRLLPGDKLTATAPIANVDAIATVDGAAVVEPLAAETTEEYRQKVLDSYQLEPQGGSPGDYRLWAADAAGVVRVYPYAKSGAPNEINVFVEANIDNGVPSAPILADVAAVIEMDPDTTKADWERGRRPLGVFQVHVLAVTLREIAITITNFVGRTAEIEILIADTLESEVAKIRPFVPGADPVSKKNNVMNVTKLSAIILGAVPTGLFDSVSFTVDGVPLSTFMFVNGDIPHIASITYA